jgi:hypothetical protein
MKAKIYFQTVLILFALGIIQIAQAQSEKKSCHDRIFIAKANKKSKSAPEKINQDFKETKVAGSEDDLALSSCVCSIPGYGCGTADIKCRNHCIRVCSHHIQVTDNNGNETTMLTGPATVSFSLLHSQKVSIKIVDLNGNLVQELADYDFKLFR